MAQRNAAANRLPHKHAVAKNSQIAMNTDNNMIDGQEANLD